MEPFIIISIILTVGLVIERIIKHFKKSTCCTDTTVEFDLNTSVYDFNNIPIK